MKFGDWIQQLIDLIRGKTKKKPSPKPANKPEPEPTPEPGPTPEPDIPGGFIWEPRSDSVRVVIPASLPHWQFHIFTRKRHYTLYGPDASGAGRQGDVEYILPGGASVWAERATSTDPASGPQMLVYVNTYDLQDTGARSAGWRILDPFVRYEGDGERLQKGQDK